jgi:SPP1 family predicted phage head-tail adaptor
MRKPKIENICHKVTLKNTTTTIGDGGQKIETYVPIATIWAAIEPSHNAPQFSGGKTEFPINHQITTRHASEYEATRRIVFGVRIFEVKSRVNMGEKNQYLVFNCEELSN